MKPFAAALLIGVASQVAAQYPLEIVSLRHRTVEQVLPVLQPLLEPGATLTGQRNQLIVRTSPQNLAELRRALEAIDRPARRLLISVRFDDAGTEQARELGASGRFGGQRTRIEVHGRDLQTQGAERVAQRIQVLEGGRAFIMAGRAVPVAGGIWETGTGFEAVPRLAGDRVTVDIVPQKESFDRHQRMSTTVSARLGEWFEVGGIVSSAARDDRGISSSRGMAATGSQRVWLKVEELP